MTEINNNILEGHYSTETKVKRPKITVAEAPAALPKHTLFLKKKQSKRLMQLILTFTKVQKGESKNDFNKSLYFKIFGGVALATAGIAGINKIRDFFRKS